MSITATKHATLYPGASPMVKFQENIGVIARRVPRSCGRDRVSGAMATDVTTLSCPSFDVNFSMSMTSFNFVQGIHE